MVKCLSGGNNIGIWEGIRLRKFVADCDLKNRKIDSVHTFATCLKQIKNNPNECDRMNCIIAKLIQALIRRGAKI